MYLLKLFFRDIVIAQITSLQLIIFHRIGYYEATIAQYPPSLLVGLQYMQQCQVSKVLFLFYPYT